MSNGLQLNTSTVIGGLENQTFTVVTAGFYTCSVECFLRYRAAGSSADSSSVSGASDVSVVVKQNNTTVMTLSDPAPTQQTLSGTVRMSCAASDVIHVNFASTEPADAAKNVIKTVVNLYQGV